MFSQLLLCPPVGLAQSNHLLGNSELTSKGFVFLAEAAFALRGFSVPWGQESGQENT